jgi:MFS superfamily sulfate permease-like transporter
MKSINNPAKSNEHSSMHIPPGTQFDQGAEVRGLGFANLVCGGLGGLPCSGVLIRTSLNAQFGATSKMSQFLNAMVVLLFAVIAMPLFSYI